MRRLGCLVAAALGCLAFVMALGLLSALRRSPPEPWLQEPHAAAPSPSPAPTPTPLAPRTARRELRRFERTEAFDRYVVRYGFVDYERREHDVSCSIGKAAHARAVEAFGYRVADVQGLADAGLRAWLDQEAASRGVSEYVRLHVARGSVSAEPVNLPADLDQRARILGKLAEFYTVWPQVPDRWQALRDEAYGRRGFLRRGNILTVDHGAMVVRSEPALLDCTRALGQAARGYDVRQEAGLVTAFFQEIPYAVPPVEVDGRQTLGLWVPSEVLVGNHGDCDSKSLAFGAVWRGRGRPVLVVDLPSHVLVGVEMRPGPDDKFVRLGNRYFVLCEVAGPAKLRPGREGQTRVEGHFAYTLVEPEGEARSIQRGESQD